MFDAHSETAAAPAHSCGAAAGLSYAARPRFAERPHAIATTRLLVCDAARSDRERLAVSCLRLVLGAYEDADISAYALAYECAERHFGRRWAVDYVRAISAIVRTLRRDRDTGFRFLRNAEGLLTADEDNFLSALQAAIDGNSVGVEAGSIMLAQSLDGRNLVDDFWRLAKLTMAAGWLRGAPA
ncbi:MAG: hypothetical protein QM651_02990 [Rhodoblastus sp.]